jgi:hypothetical protein
MTMRRANLRKYGGFSNLEEFRRETGIGRDEVSDVEALKAINLDIQEQAKQSVKDSQKREAAARMQSQASQASYRSLLQERADRNRNPFLFERERTPFYHDAELMREKIKRQELEELLLEERRKKRRTPRRSRSPVKKRRKSPTKKRKKSPAKKRKKSQAKKRKSVKKKK